MRRSPLDQDIVRVERRCGCAYEQSILFAGNAWNVSESSVFLNGCCTLTDRRDDRNDNSYQDCFESAFDAVTDILVLKGVRLVMITLATEIALGVFGRRTGKYASAISYAGRRRHDSRLSDYVDLKNNVRSDLGPAALLRFDHMIDHTSRWDKMLEVRVSRHAVRLTYTPCLPPPAWYDVTPTSMRRSRGLGLIGFSLASEVARWVKISRPPPPSRLIATFFHPSIHPPKFDPAARSTSTRCTPGLETRRETALGKDCR